MPLGVSKQENLLLVFAPPCCSKDPHKALPDIDAYVGKLELLPIAGESENGATTVKKFGSSSKS